MNPLSLTRLSEIKRRWFGRMIRGVAATVAAVMLVTPAQAAFHLWEIREIYSDASGSVQFIEMFSPFSSQQFVNGQVINVNNVGNTITHSLTLTANLPADSAGRALLLGTANLQSFGGPAPDFIIPSGFLFPAGGSISFFGANSGPYTAIPTDGINSRTWTGGNAINSPQNFGGQSGTVVVPEPGVIAILASGVIGVGCLLRRRQA